MIVIYQQRAPRDFCDNFFVFCSLEHFLLMLEAVRASSISLTFFQVRPASTSAYLMPLLNSSLEFRRRLGRFKGLSLSCVSNYVCSVSSSSIKNSDSSPAQYLNCILLFYRQSLCVCSSSTSRSALMYQITPTKSIIIPTKSFQLYDSLPLPL